MLKLRHTSCLGVYAPVGYCSNTGALRGDGLALRVVRLIDRHDGP